ncbi:PaREP1 family protein [Pyrobaculum islandicum]|uniref:PaREP1 family protein n=1 Tax=Pyrobaculum islandicum TaxID=2277 RepID=UPI000AB2BBAF|nr:PaREP1 family protein [Pyrobaculum islandicum]
MLEAELAVRFLEQGLMRNAAGKAWQAWKALLAAAAAQNREAIASRFGGVVKDKNRRGQAKVGYNHRIYTDNEG